MTIDLGEQGVKFAVNVPLWGGDDEWLKCVAVREETHDVKTFTFCAKGESRMFRFFPGQFITFAFPIPTEESDFTMRSYTISSSPTRPDTLAITVKRVAGGVVSNWLHDNVQPGMVFSVRGPSGPFSCFSSTGLQADTLLFISAGSGITPMLSMCRTIYDLGIKVDIDFVHAARTPQDIICADEIAVLARSGLRSHFVCTKKGLGDSYNEVIGHLNIEILQKFVPDFHLRSVYCCGPASFMEMVRTSLQKAGLDMSCYHQESFVFENVAESAEEHTSKTTANQDNAFQITLAKKGITFPCHPEQFILQAVKKAGVSAPSSCGEGICATCRALKISGEVNLAEFQVALRPREIDEGWILPCCSKPLSDVTLDL